MIKYIGSKRTLVPRIVDIAQRIPGITTACDLFTGTTRVAQGLKAAGLEVTANDTASYSEVLGLCYIAADARTVSVKRIEQKLAYLTSLPGVDGYFTETFCRQSRYFQEHNGRRIDAIRPAIDEIADDRVEWAILLTSLMEAADRVDSTTGVQMAYLKSWSKRSFNDIELRVPNLVPGSGRAFRRDANECVREADDVDLIYIDPPYNQHSYSGNYHIWETLVRNDSPEPYGIACKRVDTKTNKSRYNSKRLAWTTFVDLIENARAPYLLVSFSNEGYFETDAIVDLLRSRGDTAFIPVDFKRYVGAQIGIHNLSGEKVGKVSHLRNTEFLFLVGEGAGDVLAPLQRAVDHGPVPESDPFETQLSLEALG